MTDTSKVLQFLEAAAERAEAGGLEPPPDEDAVGYTRARLTDAVSFAHAGADIPADARLRPVKQALLTAVRPVTSNQRAFNEQLLAAVDGIAAAAESLAHRVEAQAQRSARVQAGVATTELTVEDLEEEVRSLTESLGGLRRDLDGVGDDLRHDLARLREEVRALGGAVATVRARQDLILRVAREALPAGADTDQLRELTRELGTGHEELYQELEDTFRGSRDHVRELAGAYIADIEALPGSGPVVDVGCGRGEWLEALRDAGIEAYGVDTNEVVVERCRARGLDVRHEDALVHLRDLPEGSVRAVTSFHLVEHLSLDTLVGFIEAALVALRPDGLLVLETPNPTNLNVGAASFYLDPTHLKPLHPQFLQFLVVARGFLDAEVRYLHSEDVPRLEPSDLVSAGTDPERVQGLVDRLNWALAGPLDYAVLARKAPSPSS